MTPTKHDTQEMRQTGIVGTVAAENVASSFGFAQSCGAERKTLTIHGTSI
jgi:hypothetical protein